jgi:hypothetical protein
MYYFDPRTFSEDSEVRRMQYAKRGIPLAVFSEPRENPGLKGFRRAVYDEIAQYTAKGVQARTLTKQ